MIEYDLLKLDCPGDDILHPNNYTYKSLLKSLGRPPKFEDLHPRDQKSYQAFVECKLLAFFLTDTSTDLYVRLNTGARAGSIAKVVKRPGFSSGYNNKPVLAYDAKMGLAWDDGKTWEFAFARNLEIAKKDRKFHTLLVGYTGPTSYVFTKTERVDAGIPTMYDAYNKEINVGSWVMNEQFRIGKITRISSAGTMWVDFVGQKFRNSLGSAAQTIPRREQCGSGSTFLSIEVPEEFEAFAMIMDRELSGVDILPTFNYAPSHD